VPVVESFVHDGPDHSPVFGPCLAIPLDFPSFLATEKLETGYRSRFGSLEARGAEMGFAIRVKQTQSPLDNDPLLDFLPRGSDMDDLVSLTLSGPYRRTRQIWQSGQPWPTVSDNGVTVARLVEVVRSH
jgi:hypothetical protein